MICTLSRDKKAFRFDVLLIDHYNLGYDFNTWNLEEIEFGLFMRKIKIQIIETNLFRDDIKENFSK